MTEPTDAAGLLARNAAELPFERLPEAARAASRANMLDTLGTAIAGGAAPGCREVTRLVLDNYAGTQATVWGTGRKAAATEAALANGTMAHALDFDDTHDGAVLHAGVSVVPAALATAEQLGGVSGRELVAAVTLGLDCVCRMGMATKVPPVASGWMYTSLYGFFGATIAAGRLMRLDAAQMAHAMGIAYAQAAGNTQCMPDGSLTKRMQPGFAARGGVLSALLARAGITGTTHTFDGRAGLFKVYLDNAYDRERLLEGLGSRFEGVDLSYKPYPACRYTHTAIDATLKLMADRAFDADAVDNIRVGVNDQAYGNVCMPLEVKTRPRVVVDAQFSIPFCVATAILKGDVFIDDFSPAALQDPAVLRLAAKVRPYIDPDIQQHHARDISPAAVTITLKDGSTLSFRKDAPRGGPGDPMSFDELAAKFRRCARHAGWAHNDPKAEQLIAQLRSLELLPDTRALTEALA